MENLLGDAGYLSADNVAFTAAQAITPSLSDHREHHNVPLRERFWVSVKQLSKVSPTNS